MKRSIILTICLGTLLFSQEITVTHQFTSCGQNGQGGPTQENANTAYSGTNLEGLVTVDDLTGIQYWTVPYDGVYDIEAAGASGGGMHRGYGARVI